MWNLAASLSIVLLSLTCCAPRQSGEPVPEAVAARIEEQVTFAETAADSLTGPQADEWMSRLDSRYDELSRTLEDAIEAQQAETALRLVVALSPYWDRKSEITSARAKFDRVLELGGGDAVRSVRASALLEAGYFAFRQEDQHAARSALDEALSLFEQLDDERGAARAHVELARLALRNRDHDAVAEHARRAASTFERLQDRASTATARHMLAASAEMTGDLSVAAALYEELYQLQRELDNPFQEAVEQYNLASVRLSMGALDEAEAMLTESLSRSLSVGDEIAVPYALLRFAALALERGEAERGARLLGATRAQFEAQEVLMDPAEETDFEGYRSRLRSVLGETVFEAAFSSGQSMDAESALALARSSDIGAPGGQNESRADPQSSDSSQESIN